MTITSDSVSPPTLTVKPRRTDLLYDAKPRSFVIRGKHSAEALQFISKHLSLRKNEKTSRKMKKVSIDVQLQDIRLTVVYMWSDPNRGFMQALGLTYSA